MTASEVSERTGVTLRRLQWWDERGIVCPVQDRGRRRYSEENLRDIRLIGALRDRRVPLQVCKKILRHLRKDEAATPGYLLIDENKGRMMYMQDDARKVCHAAACIDGPVRLVELPCS